MGYIPKDASWYLANIIMEHIIEGDSRNVVHVNQHLIKAKSPDEAYKKSLALGRSQRMTYKNTEGKKVKVAFRGLADLLVIYDKLKDGAELSFSESVNVSPAKLKQWVTPKASLGVFAPIVPRVHVPNYMPESVMKMLEAKGYPRLQFDPPRRSKREGGKRKRSEGSPG